MKRTNPTKSLKDGLINFKMVRMIINQIIRMMRKKMIVIGDGLTKITLKSLKLMKKMRNLTPKKKMMALMILMMLELHLPMLCLNKMLYLIRALLKDLTILHLKMILNI